MIDRSKEFFDFKKIIFVFYNFWYWFVLSILFLFFLTFMYNRYSDFLYTSNAKILIQTNKSSSINKMLYEVDQFKLETSLNDELMVIKSYPLVLQTILDLNFDIVYYISGNIKTVETFDYFAEIDVKSNLKPYGLEFLIIPIDSNKFKINSTQLEDKVYNYDQLIQFENSVFSIKRNKIFVDNQKSDKFSPLKIKFRNPNNIAKEYLSKLSVNRMKKDASIIELSFSGNDKAKNIKFLNKLIDNYLIKNLIDKNKASENALKFIDNQLKETRDSLSLIERQLQRFKTSNNITNISVEAERFYNELNEYEKQKASLRIQNKYFDYLEDYLHKQTDFQNLVVPVSYGINDQMLNNMTTKLVELQLEKNLLNPNGILENPSIKDLDVQIFEISLGIIEIVKGKKKTNKILLSDLNNQINLVQNSLNSLPQVERELININRLYDLSESIYLFLMQKRAEAGISGASSVADAKIIEPALEETTILKKPQIFTNYLIGLFFGFLIPLIVLFLQELFNDKILLKSDISDQTDAPFLGFIFKNHSGKSLITKSNPKSSVSESFRLVASNINFFLDKKDEGDSILFTSSISGEGKTFSAKNLAVIFSSLGKKVILVGADLRRPKLYLDFISDNKIGLSNYLSENIEINNIIKKTDIKNLNIINSGPIPPNPSELLSKNKMKELIISLKKSFDYVIIDTPPIGIVSDSIVLTEFSDLNIFLVRQNFTKKRLLENINDFYVSKKIKNLCILLNEIKGPDPYGYRYGYSYDNYSEYYDLDNDSEDSKKWYKLS